MPAIIFSGDILTGDADSEVLAGMASGTSSDTINANGGNDLILGDSDFIVENLIGAGNISLATALNVDTASQWSAAANPIVSTAGSHTSIYVEGGAGQQRYFAVTVGAGETIVLDVDFTYVSSYSNDVATNWAAGSSTGYVLAALALLDSGGAVLASAGYTQTADPGSPWGADPSITFTATSAGTYYIRVGEIEPDFSTHGSFEGGEQVFLNVSVSGHAATGTAITAGNDTIDGGDGQDIILGMLGTDTVHGGAENDTIYSTGSGSFFGDDGYDYIYATNNTSMEILDGGADADTVDTRSVSTDYSINLVTGVTNYANESFVNFEYATTGAGNDTVIGTDEYNFIQTGAGNDVVEGGGGHDNLQGEAGSDTLYGEEGDDYINGGYSSSGDNVDTLVGGGGNDTLFLAGGMQDGGGVFGGEGIDTFNFYNVFDAGDVTVQLDGVTTQGALSMATTGLENFSTYSANNFTVFGTAGANIITTSNGNDTLNGGAGSDTLTGFGGNDRYHVDAAGDVVVEAAGGGSDRVFAGVSYALGVGQEIEILTTTNNAGVGAINLTGNELVNSIAGNNGANTLIGGAGADTLNGLGGNDMLYVDNAADVIVEAAGGGSDRVLSSVSYSLGAAAQVEILSTTNSAGTAAINLTGNGFANSIAGNNGANTLVGGAGADTLNGLGGNDLLYVDNAADVIVEAAGGGSDRVFASVSYALGAAAQVEILSTTDNAGMGAINLTGNGFANSIAGNAGANVLDGGGGSDTLNGLGGNDMFYVDQFGDVVIEAAGGGSDRIFASSSYAMGTGVHVEILSTTNNAGLTAINLAGNELANSIAGNAGANVLNGLGGNDTLNGLGGADTFRFSAALGAGNVDTITGYVVADDGIQIDNAVFTGLAAGALAAGAFRTGAAAADADDRIIYNSATGALLFDADGNGAGAAGQFATLSAGLAMAAGEFVVI